MKKEMITYITIGIMYLFGFMYFILTSVALYEQFGSIKVLILGCLISLVLMVIYFLGLILEGLSLDD